MSETPAVVGRSGEVAAAEERGRGEALRARLAAVGLGGLHLAALSSFAVAQPLFDLLGKTPEFFAVRGSSPREIVVFALAVAIGVPAALVLVELLVAVLAGWLVARALHLLLVTGLVALFALQLLKRVEPSSGRLLVALAVAGGALFAAAYARSRPVRAVVTVLGPAPLLFLGLFLFGSSATKLVFPDDARAEVSVVAAKSETPVVVIVFDEFTSTSLLDRRGRIDAGRFPNFAALARTSTWYPDATAVSQGTTRALPAILSGKDSGPKSLPTFEDHPQNLFTLFGRSHVVRAWEPVTRLCPAAVCPRPDTESLRDELASLGSDLSVVYLHLLLPEQYTRDLPPITQAWGNFRDKADAPTVKERLFWEPAWAFDQFLASIQRQSAKPPFFFAHVNLPHVPYRYLPSGRSYTAFLPGLKEERWERQAWPILQAQQRYLLQVGHTDRLLGKAVRRLREAGLFDRSVVVVTADHGVSFRPGNPRRDVNTANFADIGFVPLFVKAPGQRSARVRRGVVRSVDILPTVARYARVSVPWRTDGRFLDRGGSGGSVRIDSKVFAIPTAFAARDAAHATQARLFGEGTWRRVYAVGPYPGLVGRPVAGLPVTARGPLRARFENEHLFEAVDLDGPSVPSFVLGRIERVTGGDGPIGLTLAVAVNGVIRALARSYSYTDATSFSAVIPDAAFSPGRNQVEVFTVTRDGAGLTLTPLGRASANTAYRLVQRGSETVIQSLRGERIPVRQGAVSGYVDIADFQGDYVRLFGWAADVGRKRIRDRVLVFADGRLVNVVDRPLPGSRSDLAPGLEDSGFSIYLHRREVLRGPEPELRVFGVVGGVASELGYPAGYAWGPER